MKKILGVALLPMLGAALLPAAALADLSRGEALHESQCIACHASRFDNNGAEIYTRDNRRVNDLAALHKQVNRCKNNLGLTWFDDEVKDVADYLNASYYKFGQ
ncbi:MAG: cytochrome c [Gammaproteobacteria bacterium]|nr:cytochrome c [Gammaproteobacteria bacterium]MCW8928229.1 cytochrome c [Gammaproteobacteria bacterium]MCW8957437.1 cytochrome c [Gammaproteobacteria bacterium]MCW8974042.1 cytochrome c [Gammaproteobacteria bacterium]MCW8993693.1 cytochrome c [Gammaproteobacteria bacterium]